MLRKNRGKRAGLVSTGGCAGSTYKDGMDFSFERGKVSSLHINLLNSSTEHNLPYTNIKTTACSKQRTPICHQHDSFRQRFVIHVTRKTKQETLAIIFHIQAKNGWEHIKNNLQDSYQTLRDNTPLHQRFTTSTSIRCKAEYSNP